MMHLTTKIQPHPKNLFLIKEMSWVEILDNKPVKKNWDWFLLRVKIIILVYLRNKTKFGIKPNFYKIRTLQKCQY
jgi:hypothetical protein